MADATRSTTREPFTDETNHLCDMLSKTTLRVDVPKGGEIHYGSDPTSSRRLALAKIEHVNELIRETAMKLQHLRKGIVSFAVFESMGDDAEREGRPRGEISWDTVDRTCTYYEKYAHDKSKDEEMRRRRVALEYELDDLQRVREHLISVCMGR